VGVSLESAEDFVPWWECWKSAIDARIDDEGCR